MSISDSELLVSWINGYCLAPHLIYWFVESQPYILLWFLVTILYMVQKSSKNLVLDWINIIDLPKKILSLAPVSFLLLSIIKVVEVLMFA